MSHARAVQKIVSVITPECLLRLAIIVLCRPTRRHRGTLYGVRQTNMNSEEDRDTSLRNAWYAVHNGPLSWLLLFLALPSSEM